MSIQSFRRTMMLAASVTTFSLLFGCGGGGGGGGGGSSEPSTWSGTKQLGVAGVSTDGVAIATDASGNVLVAGTTSGGLDGNTLAGFYDVFLTKYSSSGAKKFTRQLGVSGGQAVGYGVAVDGSNNVYVVGQSSGNLDGQAQQGTYDAFLIKYNSSGTKQFTKLTGVSGAETRATAVAVDSSNNLYVVGYTAGGLDGNTSAGHTDVFVTKYNSSGVKQFTKQFGVSGSNTEGTAVALDSSGNVYVVGDTMAGLNGQTQTGEYDLFLLKLDSSGNTVFTRQMGSTSGRVMPKAVAIDGSGRVNVAGTTTGDFDGHTLVGSRDTFLVQFNSSGTKQFSAQLGVTGFQANNAGAAVDSSGNVYLVGYTSGGLDGNVLTGTEDAFLTKFDSDGIKQFTLQLGVVGVITRGYAVAVNKSNEVFITGRTSGGLDGNTVTGSEDVFVTKYNSAGVKQ